MWWLREDRRAERPCNARAPATSPAALALTVSTLVEEEITRLEPERVAPTQGLPRDLVLLELVRAIAEQEKEVLRQEVARLEKEKAELEANYLAKVNAGEARKANLANYRQKHANTRRGLKEEVEEVIASKDKWIPHAREQPRHGKLGKPPGRPGGGKTRPEVIHKRIHVMPDKCAHCGAELSEVPAHVSHTHVFTDLENLQGPDSPFKVLTLLNTMLVMYRRRCPSCRRWITAGAGPLAYLRYGLNFVTYVISKRMRSRLPFEIIVGELVEEFGDALTLSAPAIVDFFKRHEPILEDLYAQLKKIAALMANLHADETGLSMNGKNWWTWVICNDHFVWYLQRQSRGHTAIQDILDGFEGMLTSDCWGAYNQLDAEQQKCLAHFVTELLEIMVKLHKDSERAEQQLVEHAEAQASASDPSPEPKRGRPKKKAAALPAKKVKALEVARDAAAGTIQQAARVKDFLDESWKDGPRGWQTPLDKRTSKEDAEREFVELIEAIEEEGVADAVLSRILKRCHKYAGEMFTYFDHEGVEPDNNGAERDLRPMVVQRKVSGSFKSPLVGEVYHFLKSLLETCRKNDKSFSELHARLLAGEVVDLSAFFFD